MRCSDGDELEGVPVELLDLRGGKAMGERMRRRARHVFKGSAPQAITASRAAALREAVCLRR